jgi:hypothetical protein
MTEFNDHSQHTPTPEFQASLKRELRRVYRAEQQFDPPRTRGRRLGMVIGLVAGGVCTLTVGLVLGAATGYASAENLSVRQREATVSSVTSRRQFAAMRLELARANYDAVRRDFEAGRTTAAALRSARAEVDSMEANVSRVETDLEARVEAGVPAAPAAGSGLSLLRGPMRNAITALTCGTVAAAQTSPAQQGVPVVNVTPAVARTTTTLGAVLGVRELSDGKLLVNDAGRRQIRIFNATLANATVALDSTPGASNSYGPRRAEIFPYLGDTTAFTEILATDVLLLDRTGRVARAVALPQQDDGITPFAVRFPMPSAIDNKGRLLARGGVAVRNGVMADSSLIYRADLDTRQIDVVGAVHLGSKGERNRSEPPEDGKRVVTTIRQPVPTEDAWAVLSDGTIALVRGQDYHVDWILPDGSKSATTRLPFDWKRLTDEDKQKLADSAKVVWDSLMVIRNARNAGPAQPARGEGGSGDAPAGRGRSGGGVAEPGSSQGGSIQRMVSVPLSDIPDFYPPVRRNSAMADLDGNLWILPTTSAQSQRGELVYDVVNPKKGLFQRVRMPVGRSIAGFGKGGVLYLQSGDMANGFHLERVKIDVPKPQK